MSSTPCIFHDSLQCFPHWLVCFGLLPLGGFLQVSDDAGLFTYCSKVPESWLKALCSLHCWPDPVSPEKFSPSCPGVGIPAASTWVGRGSGQGLCSERRLPPESPGSGPMPPPVLLACLGPLGHGFLVRAETSCVTQEGRRLPFWFTIDMFSAPGFLSFL